MKTRVIQDEPEPDDIGSSTDTIATPRRIDTAERVLDIDGPGHDSNDRLSDGPLPDGPDSNGGTS